MSIPIPTKPQSDRFKAFMPFIIEWEGSVFENDPDDPGGATKYGIDQRSHPTVNIRELTLEAATEIYWKEWLADGCEAMPSPYAEVFFNCAVNMGLGRAKQFDARIPGADANAFLDMQESYYRRLGEDHRFHKFQQGWLNRTGALRKRFSIE